MSEDPPAWYDRLLNPRVAIGILLTVSSCLALPLTKVIAPPADAAEAAGQLVGFVLCGGRGVWSLWTGLRKQRDADRV